MSVPCVFQNGENNYQNVYFAQPVVSVIFEFIYTRTVFYVENYVRAYSRSR